MGLAQASNSILPVNRGAMTGINTYHRYLVQDTVAITSGGAHRSARRWHNELDKIYFQLEWVNIIGPAPVTVTTYIDVYLVPDNVEDTEPYASYQLLCPPAPIATPGVRSFPIGGLPMYGSMEYFVAFITNKQDSIEVRLWAIPELWYSFRQVVPEIWTSPT
jgi:hypothetical protein